MCGLLTIKMQATAACCHIINSEMPGMYTFEKTNYKIIHLFVYTFFTSFAYRYFAIVHVFRNSWLHRNYFNKTFIYLSIYLASLSTRRVTGFSSMELPFTSAGKEWGIPSIQFGFHCKANHSGTLL